MSIDPERWKNANPYDGISNVIGLAMLNNQYIDVTNCPPEVDDLRFLVSNSGMYSMPQFPWFVMKTVAGDIQGIWI